MKPVFTERTQIFTINSSGSPKWIFHTSNCPRTFFKRHWPFYCWIHGFEHKGPKFIEQDSPHDLFLPRLFLGSPPAWNAAEQNLRPSVLLVLRHHLCPGRRLLKSEHCMTKERPALTFPTGRGFLEDVLIVRQDLLDENTPPELSPSLHLLDHLLQLGQLLLEGSNHAGIIWYRHIKLL